MFKTIGLLGRVLFVSGTALILTPQLSFAQHHGGGGHAGGGHAGGAHYGGGHYGGYHGGGGYYGGHHGGYYGHSYYGYGGYSPFGYGGFGYGGFGSPFYYGSGYYPYFGSGLGYGLGYGSGLGYGYSSGYPTYVPNATSGYSGIPYQVVPSTGSYQPYYPSAAATTTQPDTLVHLKVQAPADARIWIQGTEMTSSARDYVSPPLTPGGQYRYTVRASWTENGREVSQTREVDVRPGDHPVVSFANPQQTSG